MAETHAPRRILIVRPSALGDVCRTVPVAASLRVAYPGARIDWVVQDSFVAAVAAHPAVDEVIAFPRARFARWWRSPAVTRELLAWGRDLRRRRYDLVIDAQGLGRSGLITWFTRAPRRVGDRRARELAWLGCNVRHATPRGAHAVEAMLALLAADGIEPVPDLRLYVDEGDRRWWSDRYGAPGAPGAPGARYAVLAPTARWTSKRWPADRWRALLRPLRDRGFEATVLIGAPNEREQIGAIIEPDADGGSAPLDLVGATTVGQTMAVIARAGLVIAHDSAPLHMAVGFDRPCVALFGPTDPDVVGPWRRPEAVIRADRPAPEERVSYRSAKLGDDLMRRIEVADVLERMDAVLEGEGAAPRDDPPRSVTVEEAAR